MSKNEHYKLPADTDYFFDIGTPPNTGSDNITDVPAIIIMG